MIYYLIYIPFILSSFLDIPNFSLKFRQKLCWIWVIILTLFWGLRWRCGTDWYNFFDYYQWSHLNNVFTFDRGMGEPLEWGFVLLNAIFHDLGLSYTIFLLFFSFAILALFAKFCISNLDYPLIGFVFIIATMAPIFPTRQALALGIICLGYKYINQTSWRSFFKFAILVLIASFIHTSALLAIIVYFIPKIKLNMYLALSLLIGSMFIGNFLSSFFEYVINKFTFLGSIVLIRLSTYTNQETSSVGEGVFDRGIMSYMLSLFYFFLFVYRRYNRSIFQNFRGTFNCYTVKEVIRNIFSQTMQDMSRLGNYFLPSVYWGTIEVFVSFETSTRKYIFVRLLFNALMLYFFYRQLNGAYVHEYLPYNSIL